MVDELPVDDPARPRPHFRTLNLLVGRMTTIKLAYWLALTVWELWGPRGWSIPFAVAASALAMGWAAWSARQIDRRAGGIARSIPTVATAFVTASVVAAPASLPLLLIERQRSIEGCAQQLTCNPTALFLWVAVFAIGFLVIPAVFALALRRTQPT
ncbi:MAG: hypothetical protein M3P16_11530 [Chloroflexota bacterium]|nr:hypothetical protein [Chloroflexota bacterium]